MENNVIKASMLIVVLGVEKLVTLHVIVKILLTLLFNKQPMELVLGVEKRGILLVIVLNLELLQVVILVLDVANLDIYVKIKLVSNIIDSK